MKRRWKLLAAFVLLTTFVVWLEPRRVVWGWLRGEAFFRGRPTSYWRGELEHCQPAPSCRDFVFERHPTWLEGTLASIVPGDWFPEKRVSILQGDDPAALPVLRAL